MSLKSFKNKLLGLGIFVLLLVLLVYCRKKPVSSNWTYQISKVRHSYLANLKTLTTRQVEDASIYGQSAVSFVMDPSPAKFGIVKASWKSSWNKYNVWKPFFLINSRFVNGLFIDIGRVEEKKINETYIDYSSLQPNSGIIMDTNGYPTIDFFAFDAWNTAGPSNNRAIGYQVLEYLLFGEDNTAQTGGTRTSSDFSAGTIFTERRRRFLQFSSTYLVEEFENLTITPEMETTILSIDNNTFMQNILGGLLEFVEIDFAEQTIRSPYLSMDINDELSRFSDNTMVDIRMKHEAIKVALYGFDTYDETNGYFLGDLIREIKPKSEEIILSSLAEIENAINAVENPFDVAIQNTSDRQQLNIIYSELMKISQEIKLFSNIFQ